jgi:hypothetical protein
MPTTGDRSLVTIRSATPIRSSALSIRHRQDKYPSRIASGASAYRRDPSDAAEAEAVWSAVQGAQGTSWLSGRHLSAYDGCRQERRPCRASEHYLPDVFLRAPSCSNTRVRMPETLFCETDPSDRALNWASRSEGKQRCTRDLKDARATLAHRKSTYDGYRFSLRSSKPIRFPRSDTRVGRGYGTDGTLARRTSSFTHSARYKSEILQQGPASLLSRQP